VEGDILLYVQLFFPDFLLLRFLFQINFKWLKEYTRALDLYFLNIELSYICVERNMEECFSEKRVRKIRNECHNILMAKTQIHRHGFNGNLRVIQNNLKQNTPEINSVQGDIRHNLRHSISGSSDTSLRFSSVLNVGRTQSCLQNSRRTMSQVFEKNTNCFSNRKRLSSEPSFTTHINEHTNMLLIKANNVFETNNALNVDANNVTNSVHNDAVQYESVTALPDFHTNAHDTREQTKFPHLSQNSSNSATGSTNNDLPMSANANNGNDVEADVVFETVFAGK